MTWESIENLGASRTSDLTGKLALRWRADVHKPTLTWITLTAAHAGLYW